MLRGCGATCRGLLGCAPSRSAPGLLQSATCAHALFRGRLHPHPALEEIILRGDAVSLPSVVKAVRKGRTKSERWNQCNPSDSFWILCSSELEVFSKQLTHRSSTAGSLTKCPQEPEPSAVFSPTDDGTQWVVRRAAGGQPLHGFCMSDCGQR